MTSENASTSTSETGISTMASRRRKPRSGLHVRSTRAVPQQAKQPQQATTPTKDQLYQEARRFDIDGRSQMDKEQLENAIAGHRGGTRHPRQR